jgi:glycerophosphoryl diester phosphodiesterase
MLTINPWLKPDRPLSVAHRGDSINYPENTRLAFEKAIALGVDMIECDVNITRDGQLVMMHDWSLDRTTSGAGPVSSATLDEILSLDAGSKFRPEFAGVRVPTTEETLLLFLEAGLLGCFEIKGKDETEKNHVAEALVGLFRKHNAWDRVLISSYSHPAALLAKSLAPQLAIATERLPDTAPADPPEALRQTLALHSPILQHEYTTLTDEGMRYLHDHDIAVWVWTINDEASLIQNVERGADALMSDDPTTMQAVINRLRPVARNDRPPL